MPDRMYVCTFRLTWIFLLLVLPLLLAGVMVASFVILIRRIQNERDDEDGSVVAQRLLVLLLLLISVVSFACVALVWVLGTLVECLLVRVRAIDPLCGLCGKRTFVVRSADDLQALLRSRAHLRLKAARRRPSDCEAASADYDRVGSDAVPLLTPVGGGWSFLLSQRAARPPRLIMTFSGECGHSKEDDAPNSVRFYASTTIHDVLETLAKTGRTLASTPSHDTITLAGWIGGQAHGTGGSLWSPTIGRVTVVDQLTGCTHDMPAKEAKRFFASDFPFQDDHVVDTRQYIIVEVETLPVPNSWTQLSTRKLQSEEDASWWLESDSYLRCIFTGRRGSLMMLWVPARAPRPWRCCADNEHVDPHFCSRECRYFQADVLSVLQGVRKESQKWFAEPLMEPQGRWNGKTPLSNANRFSPTISALGMAIATWYHNVEVFIRISEADMESKLLTKLLRALQDYHVLHGGRTETRFGTYKGNGKLFVDFSLSNLEEAATEALRVLSKVFPGRPIAFHQGKAIPPSSSVPRGTVVRRVCDL